MNSNALRVVCTPAGEIRYAFLDERGWKPVPKSSDLWREEYWHMPLDADKVREVLEMIYRDYSLEGCRRVEVQFVGPEEVYESFCRTARQLWPDGELCCQSVSLAVAVAGKVQAGKSVLIRAMGAAAEAGRVGSVDLRFFELQGIDIGREYIERTKEDLEELYQKEGIGSFVYCLSSDRVETAERQLLQYVAAKYPRMKVLAVLTRCIAADAERLASDVGALLDGIRVIPALAEEYATAAGVIQPYGVDDVLRAICDAGGTEG